MSAPNDPSASQPSRPAVRPPKRLGSAFWALCAIALTYGYAITCDVPTGAARGLVMMSESHKPLPDASITLTPEGAYSGDDRDDQYRVRYAESGADGRFYVPHLTAGEYQVSASSRAHGVQNATMIVEEGKPSEITLSLDRTEPALSIMQHPHVFATAEEVRMPVRGYVDGNAPPGRDTLNVSLYRTRLSNVVREKGGERALSDLDSRWESDNSVKKTGLPETLVKPASGDAPVLVSSGSVTISEADKEGFYHKRHSFGKLSPGLYLAEIDHGTDKNATWMLVTDMALVTKEARGQMLAYAVDMTTGAPLSGTTVQAIRGGSTLGTGTTDARGLVTLSVPREKSTRPNRGEEGEEDEEGRPRDRQVVVATRGQDEAIVHAGGQYENEAMGNYAVAAYTDRPIYRPGQQIQYKAIVRKALDPGIRYAVPSGQVVDLELRDPDGDRVKQERLVTNDFGSVAGRADLSSEARTGVYTLVMKVNGEKHTQDFVVASYRKPEYTVNVTPAKPHYVNGDTIEVTVAAEYYFGTPVAGASADWSVYSETDWSAEYPDEYGYDPEEPDQFDHYRYYSYDRYLGREDHSGTVRLDENGKAVIRVPTETKNGPDSPQAHVLHFRVTVKDESNREVEGEGQAHVTAGDIRVTVSPEGYVAEPGKPSALTIITRDLDGKPAPNVAVKIDSGFMSWRDEKEKFRPFQTLTVTTDAAGRASTMVTPPKVGEVRINASAVDTQRRPIYAHASLWCAGDGPSDLDTEYGDLSLLTDKRKYGAGETARVMINCARTGQTVLLTVEGDRVYDIYEAPVKTRSTIFRVPIRADYGPNVMLAACYVKDKHIAKSETTLKVTQPEKEIQVEISADRLPSPTRGRGAGGEGAKPSYHPRDRITYRVKTTDQQGRPVRAELSFGVVDESIYALREDDPTLLRDAFYPRRSNNVDTSYSFAVEYLGNANKAEPQITARKKFPDTAYWNPFLRTDGQGAATVSFELPDNLTTWRATAVAQSLATTVGRSVNKVLTQKEFFVRVETPRFMTQRDASQVQALVHNDTGADQTVLLHLRSQGVTVGAPEEQTLHVAADKVGNVVWPVTAADIEKATFDVAVWTPKTASGSQYTDRVERSVPVRPHGRERYIQLAGALSPGKEEIETLRIEEGAILPASRMKLRVTETVRGAIAGALPYLVGYPYGCTEQTMSRVLPDLLAQRAAGIQIKPEEGGDLNQMLRDGLARLSRFQHPTGAWGWWEHDPDDPWMTAYVLYGLGSARSQGVPVNKRMVEKAIEGGKKMLTKVDDRDKPFLLYALALADPKGARNTVEAVDSLLKPVKQSTPGLAYMVLLEKQLGRSPEAAMAELDRRAIREGGTMHWAADGSLYSGWSERMSTAAALRAFLSVNRNDPHVKPAIHWIMMRRTGDYWEDTRDTAFVLTALVDYATAFSESAGSAATIAVTVNGKTVGTDGIWTGGGDRDRVLTIPPVYLQIGKNEVRVVRTGGAGESFYSLELRKYVGQEGMGAETTAGIKVTREYLRMLPKKAGSDYWTLQSEPTGNKLKSGDRIRVKLSIYVPKDMEYVMIEDPFPSGCEPNERGEADEWSYWYSNADVRDDRIAFFARSMAAGWHIIEYNIRAQTPGAFHTLPTFVQPMYAPEVRGESAEDRIEVK